MSQEDITQYDKNQQAEVIRVQTFSWVDENIHDFTPKSPSGITEEKLKITYMNRVVSFFLSVFRTFMYRLTR
jgi:hypothetical protein